MYSAAKSKEKFVFDSPKIHHKFNSISKIITLAVDWLFYIRFNRIVQTFATDKKK